MNYFTIPIELDDEVKTLLQSTVLKQINQEGFNVTLKNEDISYQYKPLVWIEHKYMAVVRFLKNTFKQEIQPGDIGLAWSLPNRGLEYHIDDDLVLKTDVEKIPDLLPSNKKLIEDHWPKEHVVTRKTVLFFPILPDDLTQYVPLHFSEDDEYVTTAASCYVATTEVEHGFPYSPTLRASLQIGFHQPIDEVYEMYKRGELLNV